MKRKPSPLRALAQAGLRRGLGRRDFVRLSAVMSLLAACKSRSSGLTGLKAEGGLPTFESVGAGRKVIILGGGISGLCTAYELANAGFDPLVLELQPRVGGRVYTLRNFFNEDQYAELGATRIPSHHDLTRGYAAKLGLTMEPFPEDGARALYKVSGQRWIDSPEDEAGDQLPDSWDLTAEERTKGLSWLKSSYTKLAFADLGNPHDANWPTPAMLKYDDMTFAQYLKSKGASDTALAIIRANNGSEVDMFSALLWLGLEVLDAAWDTTGKIKGGNDQLAEGLAAKLGDKVVRRAKVRRVVTDDKGVRVYYEAEGKTVEVTGDMVVCTVAPPLIAEITWEPGLSAPKMSAARTKDLMQPVTRINMQFKTRFWFTTEQLRGLTIAHTDLPIERLWDMSATQPGTHGMLTSYIMSDLARQASAVPPGERTEWALKQVETFFPQARQELAKSMTWVWHEQPWVKGGWMALRPHQFELYLALKKPEGRLFFAGDHTTLGAGWIQGAFESAHRVVGEVIASVKEAGLQQAG